MNFSQDVVTAADRVRPYIRKTHLTHSRPFSDLVNADLKTVNTFDHIQISAKNGTGINLLLESISIKINPQPIDTIIRIGVNESKIRSDIYNISNVLDECLIDENTLELKIQIDDKNLSRLKKNKKIKAFESKLTHSDSEYNFN